MIRPALCLAAALWIAGCDEEAAPAGADAPDVQAPDAAGVGDAGEDAADADPGGLSFGEPGPISGAAGRGSFTFGVATAATQIEDQNPHSDWHLWTAPEPEGLGHHTFVGDASGGYTRALDDVALITAMNLDRYRFSVEWARVEPARDDVQEEALAHYDALIDALLAEGITPMITVHHFSSPVWVDDPRDLACAAGPTDANLCGWDHAEGGPLVIEEIAEHAALLAARYGDRVDDWASLNEPVNYLVSSYGIDLFPPGKRLLLTDFARLVDAYRNYIAAHAAIYDAIKEHDTTDADGDGVAAHVGFTLSVVEWAPSRDNAPSEHPDDVAAAERITYFYHHLFPAAVREGGYDPDLDGVLDEAHPEWADRLDWLGVQYYARLGVTGAVPAIPVLNLMPCFGAFDLGSCIPPEDPTHWVPDMTYEFYAPGLYNVLADFGQRWPDLPMTVTEGGLATHVGARRAENVVRSLEQIHRAITDGVDVRGYYHWSLIDNFEWAEGYEPRFGLYTVDFDTFERTPTLGATVYGEIAGGRRVTGAHLEAFGGLGPMTEEPSSRGR